MRAIQKTDNDKILIRSRWFFQFTSNRMSSPDSNLAKYSVWKLFVWNTPKLGPCCRVQPILGLLGYFTPPFASLLPFPVWISTKKVDSKLPKWVSKTSGTLAQGSSAPAPANGKASPNAVQYSLLPWTPNLSSFGVIQTWNLPFLKGFYFLKGNLCSSILLLFASDLQEQVVKSARQCLHYSLDEGFELGCMRPF